MQSLSSGHHQFSAHSVRPVWGNVAVRVVGLNGGLLVSLTQVGNPTGGMDGIFNYRMQAALLQLSKALLARNKQRRRVREVLLLLSLNFLTYMCSYVCHVLVCACRSYLHLPKDLVGSAPYNIYLRYQTHTFSYVKVLTMQESFKGNVKPPIFIQAVLKFLHCRK